MHQLLVAGAQQHPSQETTKYSTVLLCSKNHPTTTNLVISLHFKAALDKMRTAGSSQGVFLFFFLLFEHTGSHLNSESDSFVQMCTWRNVCTDGFVLLHLLDNGKSVDETEEEFIFLIGGQGQVLFERYFTLYLIRRFIHSSFYFNVGLTFFIFQTEALFYD